LEKVAWAKRELTATLIILDEYCLKPIRLEAYDKDIALDVQFEVHNKENYTSFTFDGKRYDVGQRQGKAIKLLHKEGMEGNPDVPLDKILKVMGRAPTRKVKDSFKRTGLWGTLLVRKKNNTRRLSIFP